MGIIVLIIFGFLLYSFYLWFVQGLSKDLTGIVETIIEMNKSKNQ